MQSVFDQSRAELRPAAGDNADMACAGTDVLSIARLHFASERLRIARPELSAGMPMWRWQKSVIAILSLLMACGAVTVPREMMAAFFAVLAIPFFFVVILRVMALHVLRTQPEGSLSGASDFEARLKELPVYSVLVPLFKEAAVVPDLLEALARIDYPKDKLEVFLIVESIDEETSAAISRIPLESNVSTIIVPGGEPRTKPRALNYALTFSRGEFVVVYDAEDCPEPDQLLRALALLRLPGEKIGCVQARLNVYNPVENWLTRQFTIEYTALFDCLLPALQQLDLPVPLGGTSNHFPRAVLESIGGWDPYNVTEDADLGIRMARTGWEVRILASTTWEEAPASLNIWLKQRTRWLKGWMQTYLVHMREPLRLGQDLGPARFFGLQILMGGLILSALVHPWFYVLTAFDLMSGFSPAIGESLVSRGLWWLGLVNLVLGYVTGILLGAAAVGRRGWHGLTAHALFMPFYWIMISFAAYRAMAQLVTSPFLWEKTDHRARGNSAAGLSVTLANGKLMQDEAA